MKTIAHKYEISSDDDIITYAEIARMPTVEIDLTNDSYETFTELTPELCIQNTETDFYENIRHEYNVFADENENVYFVKRDAEQSITQEIADEETIEILAAKFDCVENSDKWFSFNDKQKSRDFMNAIYARFNIVSSMRELHGMFTVYIADETLRAAQTQLIERVTKPLKQISMFKKLRAQQCLLDYAIENAKSMSEDHAHDEEIDVDTAFEMVTDCFVIEEMTDYTRNEFHEIMRKQSRALHSTQIDYLYDNMKELLEMMLKTK